MKRKILLFPEMRVTRKICTRATSDLFFFNWLSGDILQFLLLFLYSCFVFVSFLFGFLKLKICILIHIRLYRWMGDKKVFTQLISGNKATVFGPTLVTHCSVQFFCQKWKMLTLYPFIKRRANLVSKIIVPLVSFPFSPKFMIGVYLIKCIVT